MPQFEITFLGTGTSHGVPVIGCDCAVCRSDDPRDRRLRTAILVRTPECVFAVDTPPDFREQCLRERLQRLDAAIFTHSHSDHILGFDDLRRFCEMEDRHMPVYASQRTMLDLKRVFRYAFSGDAVFRTYVRPEPVEINGPFLVGETLVTPVELPHGRFIVNGFVFSRHGRKLAAYYTDCNDVPPEAVEAARGAEVLILDALRHRYHSTHLTVEQAVAFAGKIGARRTFFIHMCHDLGHEETDRNLPDSIQLAYDGLRLELE